MCDTLCAVANGRLLFAKNSDRPRGETQVVEARERRASSDTPRHAQYLELGSDPGGSSLAASRPTWLWGFEHGINEHRVAVGNEKVWTRDDARRRPAALLGMDIVRLALEGGTSAEHALDIIAASVERYGQGGSGEQDHDAPYDSAFLVADPTEAWVIETMNRSWAARRFADTSVAISNRLSLTNNWDRASADVAEGHDVQSWRDPLIPTAIADHRLAATKRCLTRGPAEVTAREVVATLRHHGTVAWGAPGDRRTTAQSVPRRDLSAATDDWSDITVCMHARGKDATTASMITEVTTDRSVPVRAWFALGSPCVSVFIPTFGMRVPVELGNPRLWERFRVLRDCVEEDRDALVSVRAHLDPIEDRLWDAADAAFDAGETANFAIAPQLVELDAALCSLGA